MPVIGLYFYKLFDAANVGCQQRRHFSWCIARCLSVDIVSLAGIKRYQGCQYKGHYAFSYHGLIVSLRLVVPAVAAPGPPAFLLPGKSRVACCEGRERAHSAHRQVAIARALLHPGLRRQSGWWRCSSGFCAPAAWGRRCAFRFCVMLDPSR